MKKCPYCHEQVEDQWKYCRFCNKPLITDIEQELYRKQLKSGEEDLAHFSNFNETEGSYDVNIIDDEDLDRQLYEIEKEIESVDSIFSPIGELLLKKASIYYKKRDFASALKNLQLALKNFQEENNLSQIATCHNEIGLIYEEEGLFDQAIFQFDQSLTLLKKIGDKQKVIHVLNNLGNVYYLLNDLEHSYIFYQDAIDLAIQEKLEFEAVKSSSNIIEILFPFKEYDRIQKILINNFNFFKEKEDVYGLIQTLTKFGKLYYHLGHEYYDQSFNSLNDALKLVKSIKDKISVYIKAQLEWECFHYLGLLYTLWDNDIEAESYFLDALEAIRTFEVKEHIKEGIVLESLAKLYGIRGEDKKAIEYYIFAADIYKNYGNHAKYAEIYTKIAMIYIDFIQDHKNAIESYEVALEIYENLNYDRESALILTTLGDIYSKEQVINEATSYFERALAYFQDLGDNENIILLQEKLRNLDYK